MLAFVFSCLMAFSPAQKEVHEELNSYITKSLDVLDQISDADFEKGVNSIFSKAEAVQNQEDPDEFARLMYEYHALAFFRFPQHPHRQTLLKTLASYWHSKGEYAQYREDLKTFLPLIKDMSSKHREFLEQAQWEMKTNYSSFVENTSDPLKGHLSSCKIECTFDASWACSGLAFSLSYSGSLQKDLIEEVKVLQKTLWHEASILNLMTLQHLYRGSGQEKKALDVHHLISKYFFEQDKEILPLMLYSYRTLQMPNPDLVTEADTKLAENIVQLQAYRNELGEGASAFEKGWKNVLKSPVFFASQWVLNIASKSEHEKNDEMAQTETTQMYLYCQEYAAEILKKNQNRLCRPDRQSLEHTLNSHLVLYKTVSLALLGIAQTSPLAELNMTPEHLGLSIKK